MSRQLIMDFTHYTSSQCQPSHGFIPVLTRTINHSALTRTRNHGFHLVHDSTPKPNVATTVTPPSVSDRKFRSLFPWNHGFHAVHDSGTCQTSQPLKHHLQFQTGNSAVCPRLGRLQVKSPVTAVYTLPPRTHHKAIPTP